MGALLALGHVGGQGDVDGGEDAARHGQQVGREDQRRRAGPPRADGLLHLRQVAVGAANLVGAVVVGHLHEVAGLGRRAARAADAGGAIGDDRPGQGHVAAQQRPQGQQDAGRVAAGVGHQPRPRQFCPVDLGQAIDGLGQ